MVIPYTTCECAFIYCALDLMYYRSHCIQGARIGQRGEWGGHLPMSVSRAWAADHAGIERLIVSPPRTMNYSEEEAERIGV